ncbi:hypothetical protein D3C86_1618500 [compost metagenome]
MVEGFIAIAQLMKVQHDELVGVSIQKQQHRIDQFVQHPMRAKAIVVKVKPRSIGRGAVAQSDIEGPCAIGQLPGKSIVLTNRPMAEHGVIVGRFFVHTGVMRAGPDNVG